MKNKLLLILLGLGILIGVFIVGRISKDKGIPKEDVANMLRLAGDSAIASYKTSDELEDMIGEALRDSLEFYEGSIEAATQIVIRRDSIFRTDTVEVLVSTVDTVDVDMPIFEERGIHVYENLRIYPAPSVLFRKIRIEFDPDTIMAGIIKTPDGLMRFTAAANRVGLSATVTDAAVLRRRSYDTVKDAFRIVTAGSCFLGGITLSDQTALSYGAIGTCLVSVGISLMFFR